MIPKLVFLINGVSKDVDSFFFMLKYVPKSLRDLSLRKFHSGLGFMLEGARTDNDRKRVIESYVERFYTGSYGLLVKARDSFQKRWDKFNDDYMRALSDVLGIDWPSSWREFKAFVSLNSSCPRFLLSNSFNVFYGSDDNFFVSIVSHEVSHFLFFRKWLEVFPDYSMKDLNDNGRFNSPNLEWHLSEILAPVILNDLRIQRVIHARSYCYQEHKRFFEYFTDLYKNGDFENFSGFLRLAWSKALELKDEILSSIH